MLIDFAKSKAKREEKQAYRESLVNRILTHFQHADCENPGKFYLEHVRDGFPIHMLEDIAERLESVKVS